MTALLIFSASQHRESDGSFSLSYPLYEIKDEKKLEIMFGHLTLGSKWKYSKKFLNQNKIGIFECVMSLREKKTRRIKNDVDFKY